jgi:hypothetical protein
VSLCIVVLLLMCHSSFFDVKLSAMIVSFFSVFFFVTYLLKFIEYYFSNYYQYLLDYLSGSDQDNSNFVMEEHQDNHDTESHLMDSDMVLSLLDSEESSDGNVQGDCGRYCFRLQQFHKDAFYSAYLPEWENAKKSSFLISQEKYNEIEALLRMKHQKKEPARLLKYHSTYSLCGNLEGCCLYRMWNGTLKVFFL